MYRQLLGPPFRIQTPTSYVVNVAHNSKAHTTQTKTNNQSYLTNIIARAKEDGRVSETGAMRIQEMSNVVENTICGWILCGHKLGTFNFMQC